ncbi:MAG: tRNA 2-selenouridine(34) synthase MnmH [Flavisolibacter sp.]
MSVQRLSIQDFLINSQGSLVLDVRSPSEFRHAHLPGALSFPLFTDEERKQVGTEYKQQSREQAIRTGLDFFGPKMRKMVEEAEALLNQHQPGNASTRKNLFIYCWRGGMRSSAVAWLMDLYGFKVYTLAGGYKAFRNHVLKTFENPYPFRILGGFTGSGKTEVLNQLGNAGEPVVDLEGIACHMGSAFGSYRMPPQPSQEMFENLLSIALEKTSVEAANREIWMEDESQRIGDLNLPNAIWENMRTSPVYFMDIPFEERLLHLVEEYRDCDTEKLIDSTRRISKRLGPLEAKTTIQHLEEGNRLEAFRILLQYYDKRYLKGLHNRGNISALLTNIPFETVSLANAGILTKYQPA